MNPESYSNKSNKTEETCEPVEAQITRSDHIEPNRNDFSFVTSFDSLTHASFDKLVLDRINDKIKKDNLTINYILTYTSERTDKTEVDESYKIIKELASLTSEFYVQSGMIYLIFDNSIVRCIVSIFKDFVRINATVTCNSFKEIDEVDKLFSNMFPGSDSKVVSIDCYSINSQQRTISYSVDERIDETFYPESYPFIMDGNIKDFVIEFMRSNENVLILLGPPGTGKTKFIRYLLREGQDYCEEYRGEEFHVQYTNNSKVMDMNDDLFIQFISSENKILILEDIDFHLSDRKGGNSLMYKLLGSSDGLISTKNKIIISTNIDSETRIDEALVRPGRCFDLVRFRKLKMEEGNKLLEKLNSDYRLSEDNQYSLSEIYRFSKTGKIGGSSESSDKHRKGTGFV